MSGALAIGVGSEGRGDDVAGLLVARRLAERAPAALRVVEHRGDGLGLLSAWEESDRVVLIDAVHSGVWQSGHIHRLDGARDPLPTALFAGASTHALGVADAIELARTLGRLPAKLVVYGIEGDRFERGAAPAAPVVEAVEGVVDRVLAELETR